MGNIEKIINELEIKTKEIPNLYELNHGESPYENPIFDAWLQSVKRLLQRLDGGDNMYHKDFCDISFSPSCFYEGMPVSDYYNAFKVGLQKAELVLNYIINELKNFGIEKNNKVQKQIIVNNTNNIQNTSINIDLVLKKELDGKKYVEFKKIKEKGDKNELVKFLGDLGTGVLSGILSTLIMN